MSRLSPGIPPKYESERCGWSASTGLSTRSGVGQRSSRLRASWGARPSIGSGSGSGKAERDTGLRGGLTTAERQRTKELEREVA